MKTKNLSLNEMANTRNKWAVIAIDETYYWDAKIIKKAKKIECVYLVNLSSPTHLCEFAISFPAIALRNFLHNVEAFTEDELFSLEMQDVCNEIRYYHGTDKYNLVKYYKKGKEEEILDYEAANPSYA